MEFDFIKNLESCSIQLPKLVDVDMLYYSHVPTMVISILFGLFVFYKRRNLTGGVLFALSTIFALWNFLDLITWVSFDTRIIMFSWSILGIFDVLLFIFSLYFLHTFLYKGDVSFLKKSIWFVLLLPILIMTPTNLNLDGFLASDCTANDRYFLNYIYFPEVVLLLWVLSSGVFAYFKFRKDRLQVFAATTAVILFLSSFAIAGYLSDLLENYSIEIYGLFGKMLFIIFLGYLIVRFNAFNIKLLKAQALVVVLVALIGALFFYVEKPSGRILIGVNLAIALGFGYNLIKSVKREVAQREEIEKLYVTLAAANARLQELDNAKSEFISIASHQLRTPLTAIKGYVSLVLEGAYGVVSTELQEVLNKVYIANSRLSQLVENMLNISRIEAGRIQYNFSEGRIESLINELRDVFILAAKNRGLELAVDLPKEPLPTIQADMSKLREAFSNMIDNALKYTEKGSVTISAKQSDRNSIEVRIKDTGMGIDPEEAKGLFQKFARGKDSTKVNVSSTGLGLYIVKQFIEAHKGTVRIESEGKGKGTTFVATLPIKER